MVGFGVLTPVHLLASVRRYMRMLVVLLLSEKLDTSRHQEPLMRAENLTSTGILVISVECWVLFIKGFIGHAPDK